MDEYDEDCFKGEADREALAALPELDREMVLAERYERRQARKELLAMRSTIKRSAAADEHNAAAAKPARKKKALTPKHDKNIYTAERIVAERRSAETDAPQYLVRWAGYDATHDTWEPAHNLLDPAILEEWAEAQEEAEDEERWERQKAQLQRQRQQQQQALARQALGAQPPDAAAARHEPGSHGAPRPPHKLAPPARTSGWGPSSFTPPPQLRGGAESMEWDGYSRSFYLRRSVLASWLRLPDAARLALLTAPRAAWPPPLDACAPRCGPVCLGAGAARCCCVLFGGAADAHGDASLSHGARERLREHGLRGLVVKVRSTATGGAYALAELEQAYRNGGLLLRGPGFRAEFACAHVSDSELTPAERAQRAPRALAPREACEVWQLLHLLEFVHDAMRQRDERGVAPSRYAAAQRP